MRASSIRWTPRAIAVLLGVATAYAAVQTLQIVVVLRTRTTIPGFTADIFRENLTRAYIWAALTPIVFVLGARFRVDGRRWFVSVPALLTGSLMVALLHVSITAVAAVHVSSLADGPVISVRRVETVKGSAGAETRERVEPAPDPAAGVRLPSSQLEYRVRSFLLGEWILFWIVLGIYYLIDYHRRARDSERATERLATRAAHLEADAARARLRALQMELDPHFLFNILNAIGGLVRQGEGRRAVDVISKLGDVLRRGLARDRAPEVTLEEEIASSREFLELEQLRFDGELAVTVSVDPAASGARVPVLILQPLVENAVRHGGPVGGDRPARHIRVAAQRENGVLRLTVGDSGLGFPAGAVEGIGLSNTRRRLVDLYGDDAGLRIGASELGGALVEVFLPFTEHANRLPTTALRVAAPGS